ncbi:MAG: PKD domain-containing protein [Ardenticatenaceae bacterium]|nr:PKD domain-containing protein [Ardenticatenaceae bacterium]
MSKIDQTPTTSASNQSYFWRLLPAFLLSGLLLLSITSWLDRYAAQASTSEAMIIFDGDHLQPSVITVSVGTTVTWQNTSDQAQTIVAGSPYALYLPLVVSGNSSPDAPPAADSMTFGGLLPANGSYQQAFNSAGSYSFFLQGLPNVTGRIVVVSNGSNDPPTANFTISGTLQADNPILFDGTLSTDPDGDSLTYRWDFDDATPGGDVAQIAHLYAAGDYTVTLTVQDPSGASDSHSQQITVAPNPDPTGTALLFVEVTDAQDQPLSGVEVDIIDGPQSQTDSDGKALLADVTSGTPQLLRLTKDGFVPQIARFKIDVADAEGFLPVKMMPVGSVVTMNNVEQGGSATGSSGAQLSLPPNALVNPDGTPTTGSIDVAITPLDVTTSAVDAFPGGFDGLAADGTQNILGSYGTVDFSLNQSGQELQLQPGQTATVRLPLYVSTDPDGQPLTAGQTIPLWSLDEATGVWIQEGSGTVTADPASPSGFVLEATIGHFSWWNADQFLQPSFPRPFGVRNGPQGIPQPFDIPGDMTIIGTPVNPSGPRNQGREIVPLLGGRPVPVPADEEMKIDAYGFNGTWFGSTTINGDANEEFDVPILLEPVDAGGGSINLGDVVTATIEVLGDIDTYLFENGPDPVAVEVLASSAGISNLEARIMVIDPDDFVVASTVFDNLTAGPGRLLFDKQGTYRIIIDGLNNEPGGYRLSIQEIIIDLLPINFTFTSTFSFPTEEDLVYFEGTRDTLFNAVVESATFSGFVGMEMIGPSGEVVKSNLLLNSGGESEFMILPADGIYAVKMIAYSTNSIGNYTVRGFSTEISPLPVGEPVHTHSESLPTQWDNRFYAFTATVGQVFDLYFDLPVGSDFDGQVTLRKWDGDSLTGEILTNPYYGFASKIVRGNDFLIFTGYIPEAGDYLLHIDPDEAGTTLSFDLEYALIDDNQQVVTVGATEAGCPQRTTKSLRAASFAVSHGGRIDICAGSYTELETIYLHKPDVDVVGPTGSGSASIDNPAKAIFNISGNNIRLENLDLQTASEAAILLDDASDVWVGFTTITGQTAGSAIRTVSGKHADRLAIEQSTINLRTNSTVIDLSGSSIKIDGNSINGDQNSYANRLINIVGDQVDVRGNLIGNSNNTPFYAVRIVGDQAYTGYNTINGYMGGIYIEAGQSAMVENNDLGGNTFTSAGLGCAICLYDITNAQVRYNVVRNKPDIFQGILLNNTYGTVENNLIYVYRYDGIRVVNTSNLPFSLKIYHNTVTHHAAQGNGILIEAPNAAAPPFDIKNNLIFARSQFAGSCGLTSDQLLVFADYNLVYGYENGYCGLAAAGTNDLAADPLLDAATWKLTATSPARDAGVDVGVGNDFEFDLRPQDLAVDIGADEYRP